MGTSSLPLHLLFWLFVVAQSSLPCACAPIFRRHDVMPTLQDTADNGSDVPEITATVDNNPAHTVKQLDDVVKNSAVANKDLDTFLAGTRVATRVIERLSGDGPEDDDIVRPMPIDTTDPTTLRLVTIAVRLAMFVCFAWTIIIPAVIFEFVMMYFFRKSAGQLIKEHYIENYV